MYNFLVDTYFLGGIIIACLYLVNVYLVDEKIITEDIILSIIFFSGGWVTIPTLVLFRLLIWINNNHKKVIFKKEKNK